MIKECLLHFKIFKHNVLLGYMHTSIALGWLLLIVIGHIEALFVQSPYSGTFYFSVFLNYFAPVRTSIPIYDFFSFTMDLLLSIILLGVLLALFKRMWSKFFGMKQTSKLKGLDKIAMYSLWAIFPLRLIAESFNASVHNTGNFLTSNFGQFLSSYLPAAQLEIYAWWAYSIALGLFFSILPWSRYSHIFTEIFLITVRRLGFKPYYKKSGYTMFDIFSCSRCGICIDSCQLNLVNTGKNDVVPAHYIHNIRIGKVAENSTFSCLTCGRCEEACPVGVKSVNIKIAKRNEITTNKMKTDFAVKTNRQQTETAYFSGCMGKLTPSVIQAMKKIFNTAKIPYIHIDAENGICCGRPMLLSGQIENAFELIKLNKKIITESGIKTLVTSCPICLKTFKDDYNLPIEIIHHSEYIDRLINEKQIEMTKSNIEAAYHDPCELVRGLNITEKPRNVIRQIATLYQNENKDSQKLCCGGSIAGITLSPEEKQKIAIDAIGRITNNRIDTIITSCPLCKKTFGQTRDVKVYDLAEIVAKNMKSIEK
jgi:Fe-S oxidoreductase